MKQILLPKQAPKVSKFRTSSDPGEFEIPPPSSSEVRKVSLVRDAVPAARSSSAGKAPITAPIRFNQPQPKQESQQQQQQSRVPPPQRYTSQKASASGAAPASSKNATTPTFTAVPQLKLASNRPFVLPVKGPQIGNSPGSQVPVVVNGQHGTKKTPPMVLPLPSQVPQYGAPVQYGDQYGGGDQYSSSYYPPVSQYLSESQFHPFLFFFSASDVSFHMTQLSAPTTLCRTLSSGNKIHISPLLQAQLGTRVTTRPTEDLRSPLH